MMRGLCETEQDLDKNLVVASNDDDTDASTATVLDGIDDLLAWWIQHSDDSNERTVCLQVDITRHCSRHFGYYKHRDTISLLSHAEQALKNDTETF